MIFEPAYAKLNLALSVIGRRPDGRHDLRSVVVRLDWHDLVGARPVETGALGGRGLRTSGSRSPGRRPPRCRSPTTS